ncbi:MAG: hypothetical protein P8N02_11190, partial [Actinomycetota bacterium]|nr:hypothetical protein [Actinomycetota bacterium]
MRELFQVPRWALLVGLPVLTVGALAAIWATDSLMHRGKVARNVSVAGETVGGLDDAELRSRIDQIAERISRTPILIETADGSSRWSAGELGVGVDTEATFDAVKTAGGGPAGPLTWISTLNGTSKVEVQLTVDFDQARSALQATDALRTESVEPSIEAVGGALSIIEGLPGQGIDVEDVIDKLPAALEEGGNPIVVAAALEMVPPLLTSADLEPEVHEANQVIGTQITVQVNAFTTTIPAEMVAGWFASEVTEDGAVIDLDVERIMPDLETLTAEGATGAGVATFDVIDGEVQIVSS